LREVSLDILDCREAVLRLWRIAIFRAVFHRVWIDGDVLS
jgi:hypothetical protein